MGIPLANSPADVLRWLLVAQGQGADPTVVNYGGIPTGLWPIYTSMEPSSPDEVVTLYDTEGQQDGRAMVDGTLFQHYGIQVRVRSKRADDGWLKAEALRQYLASDNMYLKQVIVASHLFLVQCCVGIGVVIPLGKDGAVSKRNLFTLNLLTCVKQLS